MNTSIPKLQIEIPKYGQNIVLINTSYKFKPVAISLNLQNYKPLPTDKHFEHLLKYPHLLKIADKTGKIQISDR